VVIGGFSSFLSLLQYIWKHQVLELLDSHRELVITYVVFSAFISFGLLYWYGPPSNPRTLDIVTWCLQVSRFCTDPGPKIASITHEHCDCSNGGNRSALKM